MAEKGEICPVCNKNLKYWRAKMCRECYYKRIASEPGSRYQKRKTQAPPDATSDVTVEDVTAIP